MGPYNTTADIPLAGALIDQIIGQPAAVEVVRLAAAQRRLLLIVGAPGTGKSLLGRAVAELMNPGEPRMILALPNSEEPLRPRILCVAPETGAAMIVAARRGVMGRNLSRQYLVAVAMAAILIVAAYWSLRADSSAHLLAGTLACALLWRYRQGSVTAGPLVPKVLVQSPSGNLPFVDATGCREGALFGDVRHDPYQSGGVETAAHQLVEAGAIHRAHHGVLFIDEVATLGLEAQQLLLTAIQEKQLAITGRSVGSSGTMIMTDPVPCDFILVMAGNEEDIKGLHPALRSRLQGYGYEVTTASSMADTPDNRQALARFAAQEVARDGRIPPISRRGVEVLISEAKVRADGPHLLTTRLRELGGLLRIAGDLAVRSGHACVEPEHVHRAKALALPLEQQLRVLPRGAERGHHHG